MISSSSYGHDNRERILSSEPSNDADSLQWIVDPSRLCGGYYQNDPIAPFDPKNTYPSIEIQSNQGLLSQLGTSTLEGGVTITQANQQIIANKAYLYRDQSSHKLNVMEMIGNVHFKRPNTLMIAKRAKYDLEHKTKSLFDLIYRTKLERDTTTLQHITRPDQDTQLIAYGHAAEFSQKNPHIFELTNSSFTTCPPINPTWQLKTRHLVLNKETGRGYATHATIVFKNIPVFYFPYFNFPIDKTRKTGFLWPTLGISRKWGDYLFTPIYLNLAPNYDATLTPGLLSKRGAQLNGKFRYLTSTNYGYLNFSLLPQDHEFAKLQQSHQRKYGQSTDKLIQANLRRLIDSSLTRGAFSFRDDAQYNENWSNHIDFNYASDDYYLRDFGADLNEITQNQLLQQADIHYKNEHWHFLGRLQSYQTLHPLVATELPVQNQYRRLPQLTVDMNYPYQKYGFEYFSTLDMTHFALLKTPGTDINLPVGERIHLQPGVSLPISNSFFYLTPRLQLAVTRYHLQSVSDTDTHENLQRIIPILDIAQGLTLTREITLFQYKLKQTLEPQIYYAYIPYVNQSDIPLFDTTLNTLTYDQIFNYNRFSGVDRINNANQIGVGVSTRFIDPYSGLEKIRLGLGEIFYFTSQRVTLCNDQSCADQPDNSELKRRLSPLSGLLQYHVNPLWSLAANAIWNPISKQMDNATITLHYEPQAQKIINVGFSYVKKGGALSGVAIDNAQNSLKITDFSFAWPINQNISAVGRWSQDWNQSHFQNLIYGVQYDTCCWAVRLVGGKAFNDLSTNNKPNYNTEFYIQFALKGLGNLGSGNPTGLLSAISGYNTQFGRKF